MKKATKIVATISDRNCDIPFLKALVEEGVNVVRLNSAHMDKNGFDLVINNTRAVADDVAILMDTKGPEIRTTICSAPIEFKRGATVLLKSDPDTPTTQECICVSYRDLYKDISPDSHILIDDGLLELLVVEKSDDKIVCSVLNDGILGSRKSVNVPGIRINLPSLTPRDIETINYCIEKDVDFIAHSFVRNKQDLLDIQEILDRHNSQIKIIAKIENQEGVDNIDEILDHSFGIMIARGDLGIEVPQEKIPAIQSMLIRKAIAKKKPVIVATQMLHTMIYSPRPTRAEVSDVANAIFYRTDAVMLSGETANGKYPIEAVRTMTSIIREAEKSKLEEQDIRVPIEPQDLDVTSFLSKQAVKSIGKLGVKAIVTDSFTGRTCRNIAAYRGRATVFAICYKERTARELALSYGVKAVVQEKFGGKIDYYIGALKELLRTGQIEKDDMVAYVSGTLAEEVGTTRLELNKVQEALDFYHKNNPEKQ
ncbi:MAG: pyruvate kinase [Porphyromonas sp.]|nr:pyruvate kinase [Porphyromonas sp.]